MCLSGQVDELMQQKLEDLKLAVDGEKSSKKKKGKKSEKVRAANCESLGVNINFLPTVWSVQELDSWIPIARW